MHNGRILAQDGVALSQACSRGHPLTKRSELISEPGSRHLRIFAFDPSVTAQFDTAGIGEITISVPWERNLRPGPVGEYIEVVDFDPASGAAYKPVDLNDQYVLAQDGIAPSEANPQFHQQMVYAVAMATIGHFEQALGRLALWSSHREELKHREYFVSRLRIYPHALRDRNAFYSPKKKALLFGYFPLGLNDTGNAPDTLVYTCLSHDIIAHETTHALLDGVHPRFAEAVNPDVLAFHEAFADIVALFQRFSYPGVLRDQIARTRGDLSTENFLGQLAQQFGKASGRGSALRDAIGFTDKATREWKPHTPDPRLLQKTLKPHDRGAILVAAVFHAFLTVYRARTRDLFRLASGGTGRLQPGEIPPDLVNRLAEDAAHCAQYVLQMCIRAIDYCPPVGLTFGDYLRGIVTADKELNPDDPLGYRLAFVESFQKWGIHPEGMHSVIPDAMLWPTLDEAAEEAGIKLDRRAVQTLFADQSGIDPELRARLQRLQQNVLTGSRSDAWEAAERNAAILWSGLMRHPGSELAPAIGLVLDRDNPQPTILQAGTNPLVNVHSVRSAVRHGPRGTRVSDLVVEITQRRRGYFDPAKQARMDKSTKPVAFGADYDFTYRAGCTLLLDPVSMEVRRVIRTPGGMKGSRFAGTVKDDERLAALRKFLTEGSEPVNAFAPARDTLLDREPFALLHRDEEQ